MFGNKRKIGDYENNKIPCDKKQWPVRLITSYFSARTFYHVSVPSVG
jgi:hypothetical protein